MLVQAALKRVPAGTDQTHELRRYESTRRAESMTKRRGTLLALSAIAAVTLAACGAGSASHVVKGDSQPQATSTSTTVPVSTPVTAAPPPTTAPARALSSQTLDQVAAELGSLDTSLSTADSDLNNPQGDS
jgi:hypothetical protein